jgi:hypothetical protein
MVIFVFVASYGISKYLLYKITNYYQDYEFILEGVIKPIISIVDSLLPTGITAVLIFYLKDKILNWLVGFGNVKTFHFITLEDCMKKLSEEISVYKSKIKSAHISTATPLLFTEEYIDYYYDNKKISYDDLEIETQNQIKRTKEYTQNYLNLYSQIVQSSIGAYDKSLFFKTNINEIDKSTFKEMNKIYSFDSEFPPGTTEISFQRKMHDSATFIFAECNQNFNPEPSDFKFMMTIQFADQYKKICGYICFDKKIIKQNYEFLNFKNFDNHLGIVSNHANEVSKTDWIVFSKAIREFFYEKI